MAMMSSSLLIYLLCLLLSVSPAGAPALPNGSLQVKDVVVELNGETYDLNLGANLAFAPTDDGLAAEFSLESEGEKLFPGRVSIGQTALEGQLDGMERTAFVPLEAVLDDLDEEEKAAWTELVESYAALVQLTSEKDSAALEAEFAGLNDRIDRGEATAETFELGDGTTIETEHWSYALSREDIGELMDAALTETETGAAIGRYMRAVYALSGEALPEGGVAELLRQGEVDLAIAVEEYANEAEAFQHCEFMVTVTEDGETVEIPLTVTRQGGLTTVGTDFEQEGIDFRMIVVTQEDEDGTSATVDYYISDGTDDDTDSEEAEESGNTLAALEAAADDADEDADEEDADIGIIGGADGPTEIYVASADAIDMTCHLESFVGNPDEAGVSEFFTSCTYLVNGEIAVNYNCEGTVTEDEGPKSLELRFSLNADTPDMILSVSFTLTGAFGGEIAVEAPAGERVDFQSGDEEALSALATEAMEVVMRDGGKLTENAELARLIEAFQSAVFNPESYEYEDEDEYDYEDEETEMITVSTVAEAEEIFGEPLPLPDSFAGFTLDSVEVSEGFVHCDYIGEGDQSLSLSAFSGTMDTPRYVLDENGQLARDDSQGFNLYSDDEGLYWSADWFRDGLSYNLFVMNGTDLETLSGIIVELNAAVE